MVYKDPEYHKKYSLKNKEKIKAYVKEYCLKNKEKLNQISKEYYLENLEKVKKYKKEYCLKNKEKISKNQKEYYLENLEKVKKQIKEYCLKNPEKRKGSKRKYCLENPEKSLKSNIKRLTKIGKELKLPYRQYAWALQSFSKTVKKLKGNQCVVCGSIDRVTVHHILHKIKYPLLSLIINNGVPLCTPHHSEVHGRFSKNPPKLTSVLSQDKPIILTGLCTSSNYY